MGLFDVFKKDKASKDEKLADSLAPTKRGVFGQINALVRGKGKLDDDTLDQLEELLLLADVGVDTTVKVIERIRVRVKKERYTTTEELNNLLRDEVARVMLHQPNAFNTEALEGQRPEKDGRKLPYVILVVGVNGVGKTTTIGKLAHQFKQAGNQVVLGAADTFRAAAVDQLKVWGERVGVPVVDKGMDVDPAAVAYDTVQAAVDQHADVVIVDTAGRLQNKKGLMDQLGKIKRVMGRDVPGAPHEVLLVLDASTGQNAFQQAKAFTEATQVTALALTKLDGTAKGGVVIGLSDQFTLPVKYIGVGEGLEDLQLFDPHVFVDALFEA